MQVAAFVEMLQQIQPLDIGPEKRCRKDRSWSLIVRRMVVAFRTNKPRKAAHFSRAEGPGEKVRRLDGGEGGSNPQWQFAGRPAPSVMEVSAAPDLRNAMIRQLT